jgi:hypothetical protein
MSALKSTHIAGRSRTGQTDAHSSMQQRQHPPLRKTIHFDLRLVGARSGWQNKFPEGAAIVNTWVDGVYYRDAQVIEGFIVELADDSFGPTKKAVMDGPIEEKFHWNFRITDPESVSDAGPEPVLKPVATAAWPFAAPAVRARGAAHGMGLPRGTRIQQSTLDGVTFVDAMVVADGSIVELAELTEPERKDALMRPVVVEGSSIDSGNFLACRAVLRSRRIYNTVVVGTGNHIYASMTMCNVTGSGNRFECSADRVRVKGSKNAFLGGKSSASSTVTGDSNSFRNAVTNAEIAGSCNEFLGAVTNATFVGDLTRFTGNVSAILK